MLLRQATTGEGVILGRGATIVLRNEPAVLRVRLDGPEARRVRLAMRLGDLDEYTARESLARMDRAHADYTRQFYGEDIRDPALYHLVIDSTAIELETCVELIALAAEGLAQSS